MCTTGSQAWLTPSSEAVSQLTLRYQLVPYGIAKPCQVEARGQSPQNVHTDGAGCMLRQARAALGE